MTEGSDNRGNDFSMTRRQFIEGALMTLGLVTAAVGGVGFLSEAEAEIKHREQVRNELPKSPASSTEEYDAEVAQIMEERGYVHEREKSVEILALTGGIAVTGFTFLETMYNSAKNRPMEY